MDGQLVYAVLFPGGVLYSLHASRESAAKAREAAGSLSNAYVRPLRVAP